MDEFVDVAYVKHLFTTWESLVFLVLLPLGFLLGKAMFTAYYHLRVASFNLDEELGDQVQNHAAAIAFAGFEGGIALVMWGAASDLTSVNHFENLWSAIVWCFIGFGFFAAAAVINDFGILRTHNVPGAVARGNVAAALCVAGNYIAAGLVSLYTIGGGGNTWRDNILSALLFFVLCQAEFCVSFFLVRFAFRRYGNLDVHIRAGNVSVGVLECLARVAMSIMATNSLRTSEELLMFFIWFACSCLAVVLFERFSFYFLVADSHVVADVAMFANWGVAVVQGCAAIMFSIACMSFLPGQCRTLPQPGGSLATRLTSTDYVTSKFMRWPSLVFFGYIFLYLVAAKFIFAIPGIVHRHLNGRGQQVRPQARSIPWRSAFRNYLRRPRRQGKGSPRVVVAFASSARFRPESTTIDGSASDFTTAGAASTIQAVPPLDCERELDSLVSPLGARIANDRSFNATGPCSATEHTSGAEAVAEDSRRVSPSRACSFGGYLVSIGILLRSAIAVTNGPAVNTSDVLIYTLYWISLGLILQHVGYFTLRLALLGRAQLVSGANDATGILDACMYVVVAMQVGSNLMGNDEPGRFDVKLDTTMTVAFFALQMFCIIVAGKVSQCLSEFDIITAVLGDDDNVAVATSYGLFLVAAATVSQQIGTRTVEIVSLFVFFFIGVAASVVHEQYFITRFIVRRTSAQAELVDARNWGAALLRGSVTCGFCACFTSFAREICFDPST